MDNQGYHEKETQNLVNDHTIFITPAFRSPRQDGSDQIEAAEETTELLIEEEVDSSSPSSEDSSTSKGSSTSEPEPEPEPETEPEPEPEGSGKPEPEGLEEPKPEDGKDEASPGLQPAPSKKCQKCSRSAFRARHGEFCDGCGTTSSSGEMDKLVEGGSLKAPGKGIFGACDCALACTPRARMLAHAAWSLRHD